MPQRPDNSVVSALRALALFGTLGLMVVAGALFGVVAGLWLDRALGTGGLFLVAGILLGLAGGIYGAYRLLMQVWDLAGGNQRNGGPPDSG